MTDTCLRCGGSRMFRSVGSALMCARCDAPGRFAQTVADQSIDALGKSTESTVKHPCAVCGREAVAWGAAHARCLDHWNPEVQP
jgi:hypothetical protein